MWSAWLKILENNENYSIFNQFWTRNEQRKQESKILEIFFKVGLRYFYSRMVQICSKDFLKSTYASMYRDNRLIRLFSSTISEGLSSFDSVRIPHWNSRTSKIESSGFVSNRQNQCSGICDDLIRIQIRWSVSLAYDPDPALFLDANKK
jgi:hypothetical protein